MIDLHCHILPGIDDGAPDLETALEMARMAVADGITVTACTPHIYPGLYENDGDGIRAAIVRLQMHLDEAGIPLRLVEGADVHLAPDLVQGLKSGRVPSLNGSRYFLFEPPHHVAPPRIEDSAFALLAAGYVPVVTHPERLSWIDTHYDVFKRLAHAGCWMQLTAGAVTGRFGNRVKKWTERMMDDGIVHLLATDAHNLGSRAPRLAEARDVAARRLGDEEAVHLVSTRPQGILDNLPPSQMPALPAPPAAEAATGGFWQRLFGTA